MPDFFMTFFIHLEIVLDDTGPCGALALTIRNGWSIWQTRFTPFPSFDPVTTPGFSLSLATWVGVILEKGGLPFSFFLSVISWSVVTLYVLCVSYVCLKCCFVYPWCHQQYTLSALYLIYFYTYQ